jgi:hypothetical protein
MKILPGREVSNFEEAARLAFQEAGVADIAPEAAALFVSVFDKRQLEAEAVGEVSKEVRKRYGKDAWCEHSGWYIPVPALCFKASSMPQLDVTCQTYLVADAVVQPRRGSRGFHQVMVGPVGKPSTLALPLSFLQALLDEDLSRFRIVGRDNRCTSWEIPGLREPVRLPSGFVAQLTETLWEKPVADWLDDFGAQGHSQAPLVVGALLGLQFRRLQAPAPGQELYSPEAADKGLEALGYNTAERQGMFERAAGDLRADMILAEAIRVLLSHQA